ncbi:MAG TPA: hypothetical protein PLL33_04815 [Paracoccus sp. (in: a-proteobacteria)]|nr:hypothetical protein [Paracoccus sp. (in: a-proteobacteria)]
MRAITGRIARLPVRAEARAGQPLSDPAVAERQAGFLVPALSGRAAEIKRQPEVSAIVDRLDDAPGVHQVLFDPNLSARI